MRLLSFDGTHAFLCSCAHLVYQFIDSLNSDGDDVENDLHRRENEKTSGESSTHPQNEHCYEQRGLCHMF